MFPLKDEARNKFLEIKNKINQKDYKKCIFKADKAFKTSHWDLAIQYYQDAIAINKYESYPKNQIEICYEKKRLANLIKIPLTKRNNSMILSAKINGVLNFDFILDTGADDVLVTPDIFLTYRKANIIKDDDIIDWGVYSTADGSKVIGVKFRIRKIEIGNEIILRNVDATVIPDSDISGDNLMGGSAFEKLGKITIDYENNLLLIEK